MRSSSLITLLPLLAVTAINAHPHHHHRHHDHDDDESTPARSHQRQSRKSIAFGPSHVNAEYRVADLAVEDADAMIMGIPEVNDVSEVEMKKEWANRVVEVLHEYKGFKGQEGVDWVIREDSYKDPRTGLTHIYVKQLVNGLEVIDGDLNLNLGREGQVLGWGCNFFQGPTPTPPADGDDFISSLLSQRIGRHAAHSQCEDLTSKIKGNEKMVRKLRKMLRKIHKAEGGAGGSGSESDGDDHSASLKSLVRGALKVVQEMILGGFSSAHQFEQPHSNPAKLDKMMRKVQDQFGVKSLDQLEVKLAHMARHLEHMKDQAGVICAAPEYIDDQMIHEVQQLEDYHGEMIFHAPSKAFAKLLHHLSPTPHLLPSEEALEETISWIEEPFRESEEYTLTGVPGLEQGGATGEVIARSAYHQVNTPDGKGMDLRKVWRFVVEMKENWYEASVDVEDLRVVGVVDWASDAPPQAKKRLSKGGKQKPLPAPHKSEPYTYTVFPFGVNDPSVGNLSSEHAPWDTIASPAGWHSFPDSKNPWARQSIPGMKTGQTGPFVNGSRFAEEYEAERAPGNGTRESWSTFMTTMGNNVLAQEDWEGASNWLHNDRPINSSYIFDYEYGEPDGLRPKEYIDLAVTQLFYTSNMYHDLLYRLGFDEVSGNFQMDNFGRGGLGGDAVICQAQDGSGTDNANFMTPPDGSQPRMRMYVWDTATPFRDGDLEAGIVIHEYSHGLSTRLTGGPANSGCLGYGEAGGMGEGWGDAFATLIRQVAEYGKHEEEYGMGSWAANRKSGIRNFVYSANMTSNPSTFKTLDKPGYWGVHAIGEVWAEMLFVVVERLIEKHGFSKTLFPPLVPSKDNDYYWPQQYDSKGRPLPLVPRHGNSLLAHLLVQGMKLQPCRPTFANARDAILQADVVLTGGNNTCDIWQGFAERGLGVEAKTLGQLPWGGGVRSEDYNVPKVCMGKPAPKPKKPKH